MNAMDACLALLQVYFILMNVTVERSYCSAPITRASTCFLCPETVEFCEAHNMLFLARPEWLRLATCFSAYVRRADVSDESRRCRGRDVDISLMRRGDAATGTWLFL